MIVIAALPLVETNRALAAPAVLKAALHQHGIDSMTLDLNIEIYLKLLSNPRQQALKDFFYRQTVSDDCVSDAAAMIRHCADRILAQSPSLIALSLFSSDSNVFAAWICAVLKQLAPGVPIVIGGPGITNNDFAQNIQQQGLIDDFIAGDGEESFVAYVQGCRSGPGINTSEWQQPGNLDGFAYPDYSDYEFFWYPEASIPLIDSRGCVRNCEFCDVPEQWKRFQYKSAEAIFTEMQSQIAKYNINKFDFRSSISNGNLKEFKKLMAMIAQYNNGKYSSEQISWEGSFIVRPTSHHPESMWQHMSQTNATLFLGIESVVARVRNHLGKKFDNDDIDWHLEMAKKHNVALALLIITGYHSETLEDYEFTKQWFIDRKHYAGNPVRHVQLNMLGIEPNTPLYHHAESMGITDKQTKLFWINQNLNIPYQQREQHHRDVQAVCVDQCGFNINAG